jgi:hypothetical protein
MGIFNVFLAAKKPMRAVPALFVVVLLLAGLLGGAVSRGYSEPMNRWLRKRWGDGAKRLGSVIEDDGTRVETENAALV